MRLAVVGIGYVGFVSAVCFAERGHTVIGVDIDVKKVEQLNRGVAPIFEADVETLLRKQLDTGRLHFTHDLAQACENVQVIFIAVGTPLQVDGAVDLVDLERAFGEIATLTHHDCVLAIQSTVPVGTCDRLAAQIQQLLGADPLRVGIRVEVVSNPEFLAQGSAVHNKLHPERIVIGTDSAWAEAQLREIYAPFESPILVVQSKSAELIKYAANDFLALKIAYVNELANVCERAGADIQEVTWGMGTDSRIGGAFMRAGIGYGGSCLPKDTIALSHLAKELGCEMRTVNAAVEANQRQQAILFEKAKQHVGAFHSRVVAILGVTYKPGTDDIREAPSLLYIQQMLAEGAYLQVYDPVGSANMQKIYPAGRHGIGSISYLPSPQTALMNAELCFVLTEWVQIRDLEPSVFLQHMRKPLVFDGRNVFDPDEMDAAGVDYVSIGRAPRVRIREAN